MKYLVVDELKRMDTFIDEYNNKEEAIQAAKRDFDMLVDTDKKERMNFFVLESVNPDEEAENHWDGDIICEFMRDGKEV